LEVSGDRDVDQRGNPHHDRAEVDLPDDVAPDQLVDGLVGDEEDGAEDQKRLHRSREALDLAVAVGVVGVRRAVGEGVRHEGDERRQQVHRRVHGLGEHRHRSGHHPDCQLE